MNIELFGEKIAIRLVILLIIFLILFIKNLIKYTVINKRSSSKAAKKKRADKKTAQKNKTQYKDKKVYGGSDNVKQQQRKEAHINSSPVTIRLSSDNHRKNVGFIDEFENPEPTGEQSGRECRLLLWDGNRNTHVYLFNSSIGMITVGSVSSCNIIINSPDISAVHCRLVFNHDMLLLEDAGSSSGTFLLSGEKLVPGIFKVINAKECFFIGSSGKRFFFDYCA